MSEKLKVGIAGYGVVGKRRRSVIDAHPSLEVAAVSDRTLDGDGVFDDGVRYFDDYEKLLGEDLDVLFVCLTNDINPDATIGGLVRGMHVFCEKPPGRRPGLRWVESTCGVSADVTHSPRWDGAWYGGRWRSGHTTW